MCLYVRVFFPHHFNLLICSFCATYSVSPLGKFITINDLVVILEKANRGLCPWVVEGSNF